jgi:hypothetical protein
MNRSFHALLLFALCVPAATVQADPSAGTEKFGDYLIHYNALSTQVLGADMARQYSIERSPSRGMLNISVQKVAADGTATPVAAEISGEATNLTGQKSPITIREIPDLYVSYIGLFKVVAPDTYTFTLSIKPAGSAQAYNLRFNQNFVGE